MGNDLFHISIIQCRSLRRVKGRESRRYPEANPLEETVYAEQVKTLIPEMMRLGTVEGR